MSLARNLSRLTELRRTVGGRRATWITPLWAVVKRYVVIGRVLGDVGDLETVSTEYTCHSLDSTSPAELASVDRRLDVAEIERRVAEGQTCEIWRRDGRIVHFRWFSGVQTALPFLGLEFDPLEGDHLLFEVYTVADKRVRGVHSDAATRSLMRSRDDGHRRMIAMCGWWNTPALRVGEKNGFVRLGTVTRWQLGPWVGFTATGKVAVRAGVVSVSRPRVDAAESIRAGGGDGIVQTGEG